MRLTFHNTQIDFPRRPLIMGIINVNDDSFCGDGSLDQDLLIKKTKQLLAEGADCIDVGAESARTNRQAIAEKEEIRRFQQFLQHWESIVQKSKPRDSDQVWPPILSINTWRSKVIEQVLPLGGDLLNDMSGLPSAINAELAAKNNAALLIMHSVGEPKIAHTQQQWSNITQSVRSFFEEKVQLAMSAGLSKNALILDPGIDFAKQRQDNLQIYRDFSTLIPFDIVSLLPVSRKTVIGEVLERKNPLERDAGSMACIVHGMTQGARIFRVHNVAAAFDVIKVTHAVLAK